MRSDWLEAFLTFSESMNFTRAAAAMNISQPALHVKIKHLAEWLEQPLYRKIGRELVLTRAGRQVAAHARDQREQAAAFLARLRTGCSRSPVLLCAGAGAYLNLLGPAISQFTQTADHPLKLLTGDRQRTIDLVTTGQAHLGVTALDGHPADLTATTLTEVDQILILPRDHRLARKKAPGLADLEGEALIVPPPDRPHRSMLNRMLMNAGVSWQVAVEANGWELMMHFVGLGVGLAIVNGACRVPSELVSRPLRELPGIRYHILERPDAPQHAGTQALKALLLETAEDWRNAR
jgi:DNA-binding transcriptional LysR family regulator